MNGMKRGLALLAAFVLLFTVGTTAMAQDKSAPARRGAGAAILRDTTAAAESTEAPAEN